MGKKNLRGSRFVYQKIGRQIGYPVRVVLKVIVMTETKKGVITRDITTQECPWLPKNLPKGMHVFPFHGPTYGCIGRGIAVSEKEGETPFFEIPTDAVLLN